MVSVIAKTANTKQRVSLFFRHFVVVEKKLRLTLRSTNEKWSVYIKEIFRIYAYLYTTAVNLLRKNQKNLAGPVRLKEEVKKMYENWSVTGYSVH